MEQLEERYLLSADPILSALNGGDMGEVASIMPPVIASGAPPVQRLEPGGGGSAAAAPPFPLENTFLLNSLPGATKTIYLDFDGFITRETSWNTSYGFENIVTPSLSIDADYDNFSDAELELIQNIWERVSEDFLPFEVNVTTQNPGEEALMNTGEPDDQWGIRVAIGGSDNDWFDPPTELSASGVAHIGSFTSSIDDPCFVFAGDFTANPLIPNEDITETVTHEVGHTLGLLHDGQDSFMFNDEDPPVLEPLHIEYFPGYGYDPPSWAPIMGVSFGKDLSQWSKGEYQRADNIQDDLAIITGDNGFGYRADDHGSDIATASLLNVDSTDTQFSAEGIIEQNTDVDYFSFTVEGLGELVSFDISPFYRGPNLDVLATLYDSSGTAVATSDPVDDIHASFTDVYLTPGDYYLAVEGASVPTRFIDPEPYDGSDDSDWGYSDYGSLGYYSIEGTRKFLVVGVDFDAEGGTSPENWTQFTGDGQSTMLDNLISEAGVPTAYDLTISTTGTTIDGVASANPIDPLNLPMHAQPLDALDGYVTTGGETLTFVWNDLMPSQVYQVYVFGHADVDAENDVTIEGGQWNGTTQITGFTQEIMPDGLVVNDHEPGTDELRTLSYLAISDESGQITITVDDGASFAAAVAGLAIAPTKFGSLEGQKWNDENGSGGGSPDPGEEGLGGWTIYLDLNNNNELDLISTPDLPITQTAPNVPQEILDNNITKNDLLFEDAGVIVDVDVTLDITHTYDGDLDVYLVSPSGTRVKLFSDVGGFNDNFTNTTFDDEASDPITSGTAPFTGSFRPEENITATELNQYPNAAIELSAFDGEDADGIWTLEVGDDANADTGVLNSWSITITLSGADVYLEPFTVTDADGNYSFTDLLPGIYYVREHFQDQQILDGWRRSWTPPAVTVNSGAEVTGVNFGNWIPSGEQRGSIQGHKWNDANGDGVKGAEESGLDQWTIYIDSNDNGELDDVSAPTTLDATDLPKPITDFAATTSQVTFDGVGTVRSVEVTLDITHSFVGDLDANLISPSGRVVELFTGVGGQYNNFHDLTLSDDASESITVIGDPAHPYDPELGYYTGTWQPEGLLSDFLGEELTGDGTWTLEIRDTAFADQGTLNSWSLTITVGELFTTTDADGHYVFENLPEGQYVIREEQQTGWSQIAPETTDITGATWGTSQWTVAVSGDPLAPDGERNVQNVDFFNRSNSSGLPGDYNQDGNVDTADYLFWRMNNGTNNALPNDGGLGTPIGPAHYTLWIENFGSTSSSGGGASSAAPTGGESSGSLEAVEVAAATNGAPQPSELLEVSTASVEQPKTSPQPATADGKDTSREPIDSGTQSIAAQSVLATPVFSSRSSTHHFSRGRNAFESHGGHSTETRARALMAWLDSRSERVEQRGEGDPIGADCGEWSGESSDSSELIDSLFERLGAAVA